MYQIIHELPLRARIDSVFQALTNAASLSTWWLPGATISCIPGGTGRFPLSDGSDHISVRVDEVIPNERMVWTCLHHKHQEWIGTQIVFHVASQADATVLRFVHSGWASQGGVFPRVSYYWAALYLSRLKAMCEVQEAR